MSLQFWDVTKFTLGLTSVTRSLSEAQVKTLKYRPEFPARFGTIQQASFSVPTCKHSRGLRRRNRAQTGGRPCTVEISQWQNVAAESPLR